MRRLIAEGHDGLCGDNFLRDRSATSFTFCASAAGRVLGKPYCSTCNYHVAIFKALSIQSMSSQFIVIGKLPECGIISGGLDKRQDELEDRIEGRIYMPDIKIQRVEHMPQMKLGVIIKAAAAEVFIPIGNRPVYDITRHVMVKMQIQRDLVIKTKVFPKNFVPLHQAYRKGNEPPIVPPKEKTGLVRHGLPKTAEEFGREFFEVEPGAFEYLKIKRKNFRNYWQIGRASCRERVCLAV